MLLRLGNSGFLVKPSSTPKVQKDFLFLNYSHVWGSSTYFKYFAKRGHSVDIATQSDYISYLSNPNVSYKNIVVYLHEPSQLMYINAYIDSHPECFLIQHDDTDEEQIQRWTLREPGLYMRREQTADTRITTSSPVYPIHFPMNSIYSPSPKEYDVCFVGTITSPRRRAFVDKLVELSTTTLQHLKWYIDAKDYPGWVPGHASEGFTSAVNKSKIGIHYFGNSYDATRIWEVLSCDTALLMPKLRGAIPEQPLVEDAYEILKDDFSDLEEKILSLLEDDRWKAVARRGQEEYEKYHTLEKCCQYYYSKVMMHCRK
jgi:hypothetical protein